MQQVAQNREQNGREAESGSSVAGAPQERLHRYEEPKKSYRWDMEKNLESVRTTTVILDEVPLCLPHLEIPGRWP